MNQKKKEMIFWIFSIVLLSINLSFLHFENYFIRLVIRIPQVIIIFLIYRKLINNDLQTINKFKYIIKGKMHNVFLVIGVFDILSMIIAKKVFNYNQNANITNTVFTLITIVKAHPIITICTIIASVIIVIPFIYLILYVSSRLRDLTIWAYINKIQYFILFLIFEDVAMTSILSLTR